MHQASPMQNLSIEGYLVFIKTDILTPSPTPPLKGGAILVPSPLRGEGKGKGEGA